MSRPADTDVAVIGAGPYGLSVSAHLAGRGIQHEIFGAPMDTWRAHMPTGMYLKSEGFASNLSDPAGESTLERYCRESDIEYGRIAVPIALETFSGYGLWFQQRMVPGLDTRLIAGLAAAVGGGFELTLEDGATLVARRVVVASGVQHQAHVPAELDGLPAGSLLHTYDQPDPSQGGGRCVVLGAGQSALEAAALVAESGREVSLVARTAEVEWLSKPGGRSRPLLKRLRYPESGLGEGRAQWAYSNLPLVFHRMGEDWRLGKARTVLGPAGAWWLRPRMGEVDVRLRRTLVGGRAEGGEAILGLRGPEGEEEIATDQVVAGTGYLFSLDRLAFLGPELRGRIGTVAGAPALNRFFESDVQGLYFVGMLATPSFGPLMRFVFGARFAAQRVVGRLAEK